MLDDTGDVLFVSAWVLSQYLWLPLLLFVIVCFGVLVLYRRLLSGE